MGQHGGGGGRVRFRGGLGGQAGGHVEALAAAGTGRADVGRVGGGLVVRRVRGVVVVVVVLLAGAELGKVVVPVRGVDLCGVVVGRRIAGRQICVGGGNFGRGSGLVRGPVRGVGEGCVLLHVVRRVGIVRLGLVVRVGGAL